MQISSYGETNIIDKNRKVIGTRSELTSRKLPAQLTKKDFLQGQVVSHQSFITNRSLCQPYDLRYTCSADIDWMLQVVSDSQKIINIGQPISNYLQGRVSDNQLVRCWRERFMILKNHFDLAEVLLLHFCFGIRFYFWRRYRNRPQTNHQDLI